MKLLLSGDIEMNPGPVENVVSKSTGFSPENNNVISNKIMYSRHRLKLLDVGGGGDCFFELLHTNIW